MIGMIPLGIWMLIIVYEICSIRNRVDRLEKYLSKKEQENKV